MVKAFDFEAAVKKVIEPESRISKGQISIWGGEIKAVEDQKIEDTLEQFIKAWDFENRAMPYRIWEYVDRIEFSKNSLPSIKDYFLLERGRVFSSEGDLSLRRDGYRFLWRFVGNKDAQRPNGINASDFWLDNPNVQFHRCDESALLWGKCKTDPISGYYYWHEDRVGRAKLKYPHDYAERLMIHYTVYSERGQVAFVWWKELKEYGKGND